eukprot:TRINITY_DN321_c0_g3_i1.p1 TRINITY_DN321_c0_g3~~TRINITY_DN321_c0_g3_i1.p1  ORF type:complete len:531 (+),score=58.26 TRINITY_DN321_c0_g3_i1:61-1653(+)
MSDKDVRTSAGLTTADHENSPDRKRIAIIGAGSAGMAAAYSLGRYPEKFDVHVIEPSLVCGGVACTLQHGEHKTPVNYGVQGGSPPSHQNTIELMKVFNIEVASARLDVSFGQGKFNWKNYESTSLQTDLRKEIKRFGRVLRWISRLEFLTIFMSIESVLRLCRFSDAFRYRMVYPLVALFFGTGNQTPNVSAGVIARVFLDKSLAIFDYDPDYLLAQTPSNIAFEDLESFYRKIKESLEQKQVHFHMGQRVSKVDRTSKKGKVLLTVEAAPDVWRAGSDQLGGEYPLKGGGPRCKPGHVAEVKAASEQVKGNSFAGEATKVMQFDEVIMCCPADVARAILGSGAGFWERRVLSSVQYFLDLTVTHTDRDYMKRHNDVDDRAIYFIKTYEKQPEALEMGFELTAYQPALQKLRASGERIYQTIFLDKKRSDLWTVKDLDPSKVIDRAWWSAFSHTYKHFRWVVPWVWTLQGRKHTWYAGSWTLLNTHDIAISSGLAVAHRLGAPYPFTHNRLATATFDTVLNVGHLRWRW